MKIRQFYTIFTFCVALASYGWSQPLWAKHHHHRLPPTPTGYLKIHGGMSFAGKSSSSFSRSGTNALSGDGSLIDDLTTNNTGSTKFTPDYTLGGSVGFNVNPALSVELEYTYMRINLDEFSLPNGNSTTAPIPASEYGDHGYLISHTIFTNFVYHLSQSHARLSPFIGLGIGYMPYANLELESTTSTTSAGTQNLKAKTYQTSEGELIAQGFAGITYRLASQSYLLFEAHYATPLNDGTLTLRNIKETSDTLNDFKYTPISFLAGFQSSF